MYILRQQEPGARIFLVLLISIFFIPFISAMNVPLLNGSETGVNGFATSNLSDNYDELLDEYFSEPNVTSVIYNDECGIDSSQGCLWVPWMDSSSECTINNLQDGDSCNSGQTINFTNNCMVTDEFSQVCIEAAMGNNQTRFQQCYNTIRATNSSYGQIPGWRIYREGNSIQPCRSNINGNCDTASDTTHRFIIALYAAANNSFFTNQSQKSDYWQLANNLTRDSYIHELTNTCYDSKIGTGATNQYGQICHWLQTGADAQNGGLEASSATYSGYFSDAVIAFLQACVQTGNQTYCAVALNLSLNYLQASYPNSTNTNIFRTPPGRAFHWVNYTQGAPTPVCDQLCNYNGTGYGGGPSRPAWDPADAPRATGLGHTLYYANITNINLPGSFALHDLWVNQYALSSANNFPYRYYDNGTAIATSDNSSYKIQGFQSFLLSGTNNISMFNQTLRNALDHYDDATGTWDFTACFGTYDQNFPIRSLGMGIGRDLNSWNVNGGSSGTICSGSTDAIYICLINPLNGSLLGNVNNVTLQVNVTNGNVSSGGESSIEHTFNSVNHSWTGSYNHITGSDGFLNMTGNVFSPSLSLSNLDEYQVEFRATIGTSISGGNYKFYPLTAVGSTTNSDKFFFENAAGGDAGKFWLKHDPHFGVAIATVDPNSNVTLLILVNKTARNMQANITWNNGTGGNGSVLSTTYPFSGNQNNSINENGTAIQIGSGFIGDLRLYNFRMNGTGGSGSPGNSSMNITFFDDMNQTVICQDNGVANGATSSCLWVFNDEKATYNWKVNVTSENNFQQSQRHTFFLYT